VIPFVAAFAIAHRLWPLGRWAAAPPVPESRQPHPAPARPSSAFRQDV